nr:amidohydrolase family protein [Chloroflexia bacterium]
MSAAIWTNSTIVTMNDHQSVVDAVLTIGDRIVTTGSLVDVQASAPAGTRTIDLDGAVMFPGFIEAHNHMLIYGLGLASIDARPNALPSIADLTGAIRDRAAVATEGLWIVARGYDDNQLAERRHPTRDDLDSATSKHPVLVVNGSGHLAVANTHALQLANIGPDTVDPDGGHIVRDHHGDATGLLLETAQELVKRHIPQPSDDELYNALSACQQRYLEAGITSSHTAGVNAAAELRAHQRWSEASDHPIRVTMMIGQSMFPTIRNTGLRTGFGNDSLRLGPLKLFSDGSLIGRTAAVSEPFLDDPHD